MKVHFYATLRAIVGARAVEIPLDQPTNARELFVEIIRRYPGLAKELLDREGKPYGHIHFFINGRDVQFFEQGWETIIDPQDVITVFPAVGGGVQ